MSELREEPPQTLVDLREILLQQLSYYRASLLAKIDGLTDDQLTASILPSGWSPGWILVHLRQEYARHTGTWTWYASLSTGVSASSPLVCPEPHSRAA